jgi:hypothetical protein
VEESAIVKRHVYFRIALAYTPPDVYFVTLKNDSQDGYRGLAYDLDEGWVIEAPTPNTLTRLFVFLHECAHVQRRHCPPLTNYTLCEAEANLDTMRIFDRERLIIPRNVLKNQSAVFSGHVSRDDEEGIVRHRVVKRCLREFGKRLSDFGGLVTSDISYGYRLW